MLVILDIDGTLANTEHREHYLKALGGRPDWDGFFKPSEVIKDSPIEGSQRAVRKFQELRYDIVFLTSRDESLRDATTRWLLEHFNADVSDETLLMRPTGSMLPSKEFKAQAMQQLLAGFKNRGVTSFLFVENDPKHFDTFSAEGVLLKAPECWKTVFPEVPRTEAA